MKCPQCASTITRVLDTRKYGENVRRRRCCHRNHKWWTEETIIVLDAPRTTVGSELAKVAWGWGK